MTAPAWAEALVDEVARDYGIARPKLKWRRGRRIATYEQVPFTRTEWVLREGRTRYTSGKAHAEVGITISAGTDRRDQRIVLLHELAHIVRTTDDPKAGHDKAFWRIAWGMFERYGVGPKYALWREAATRGKALDVAREVGVWGAKSYRPRY